jgi:hypothetical protein
VGKGNRLENFSRSSTGIRLRYISISPVRFENLLTQYSQIPRLGPDGPHHQNLTSYHTSNSCYHKAEPDLIRSVGFLQWRCSWRLLDVNRELVSIRNATPRNDDHKATVAAAVLLRLRHPSARTASMHLQDDGGRFRSRTALVTISHQPRVARKRFHLRTSLVVYTRSRLQGRSCPLSGACKVEGIWLAGSV